MAKRIRNLGPVVGEASQRGNSFNVQLSITHLGAREDDPQYYDSDNASDTGDAVEHTSFNDRPLLNGHSTQHV